ncbi:MAG: hypothetical protein P8Y76_06770 [bacterium]|jgi:uncharacterized membrane protein HdeD (DUF308 family)
MAEHANVHPKGPMEMCPMASMCRGMAGKPWTGAILMLPGILLVLVGILIFVEPKVLVWLIASVAILMGVIMLAFALFIRRMSARPVKPGA